MHRAVQWGARSLLFVAVVGCGGRSSSFHPPVAPTPALVEATPSAWSFEEDEPGCASLRVDVDKALAERQLDRAEMLLGQIVEQCALAPGAYWRYGVIERERGRVDAAVMALSGELRVPFGEPAAGAQLRALLPQANRRTRRQISRLGRTFDDGIYTHAEFSAEVLVDLKCRGRPAGLWSISTYRSDIPAHRYLISCRGRMFRIFTRPSL